MQDLKLFDQRQIRTVWDEEQEKWYFCINDVIVALTDCKDPVDYFKKVRKRDPELDIFVRGRVKTQWHKFVAYILSLPQITKAVFKLIIME